MSQIFGFICLVVSVFFVANANAQDKPFEDIWTKELRESSQVCRGRLPNPLDGLDLEFAKTFSRDGAYMKYLDQPYYLRLVDAILSKKDYQNKNLSEIRCLFESPCMVLRSFADLEICTGGSAHFETKTLNNGLIEGVIQGGNGTAALTFVSVPTYTDRKSFVTFVRCMSDGTLGFTVMTNRPGLSAYTRHLIKDHLDNSGFNDNFRITTSYMSSSCKNKP